jgi:hypothetical protein
MLGITIDCDNWYEKLSVELTEEQRFKRVETTFTSYFLTDIFRQKKEMSRFVL